MLRGRKIILSKKEEKKEPVIIGQVVPVIASSLAGAGATVTPVIKPKKDSEKTEKVTSGVTPVVGSKKPATIFMIIIMVLGFYVIYDQFLREKDTVEAPVIDTTISKIDDTKDYVYFENQKDIKFTQNSGITIDYKEIVININTDSVKSLTTRLNAEYKNYTKNYDSYDDKTIYECVPTSEINGITDIEEFTYREYVTYESTDYITIVAIDKTVNICGDSLNRTTTAYVIDKKEGIIYNENSLLTLYGTTKEELVKNAISKRIDGDYGTVDHNEIVTSILNIDQIAVYVDSKECLGVYYTGIMFEDADDYYNVASVCK